MQPRQSIHAILFIFMVFLSIPFESNSDQLSKYPLMDKKISKQMNFNRKNFGRSPYKLWYALTPFEIQALGNIEKAKKNKALALFQLSLFASGDVRSQKEYDRFYKRLKNFMQKISPIVTRTQRDYDKGKIIHDEICNEFYGQNTKTNTLKGYHFKQSRVSGIFKTATFNCVSSSILYLIVARSFRLDVYGVNIPSHIFVQLKTNEGEIVEIETTQKNGYDVKHTKEFYKNTSRRWFSIRGLTPCTYTDYLNRKIISPFDVVYLNMNNQHTDKGVMSAFNKNRLLEAMGYMKNTSYAQKARLSVYNNEFNFLRTIHDVETMARMFRLTESYIKKAHRISTDSTIQNMTSVLLINYTYALFKNKEYEKSITSLFFLLQSLPTHITDYQKIKNNSIGITVRLCNNFTNKKEYYTCEDFLKKVHGHFREYTKEINSCFRYLYEQWSMDTWKKKQWEQTIIFLKKALIFSISKDERTRNYGNMTNAYIQWYNDHIREKKIKKGKTILKKCIEDIPNCKPCKASLKKLNRS